MSYFIKLGNNLDEINNFTVINKLLNKLMRLEKETESKEKDILNSHNKGEILLLDVSISIHDENLLNHINLQVNQGEKIAIVGENGSGKSIFAKTLLGLYNYTGNIYLDNININRINKSNIREQIAYVPEEPFIFSGTIRENICFGKEIENKDLEEIVEKVSLKEEIESLENKYNSYVGERGITLSGGQKQRLALARAIQSDKPILLLDEAINKLDETTKKEVFENVILNSTQTVLFITHDFSLLDNMDRVVFIHQGTSYIGTHQKLLRNTDYENMYKIVKDRI